NCSKLRRRKDSLPSSPRRRALPGLEADPAGSAVTSPSPPLRGRMGGWPGVWALAEFWCPNGVESSVIGRYQARPSAVADEAGRASASEEQAVWRRILHLPLDQEVGVRVPAPQPRSPGRSLPETVTVVTRRFRKVLPAARVPPPS